MFWNNMLASPWSGQGQNRNTLDDPDGRNRGAGGGRVGATGAANARRRQLAPEPYSLGHLRVLFQRLIDAQEGKGEGETTVVETLRAISEVVVYGENQDAKLAAKAAKEEALLHEEQEAVYQAEGAGLDPDGNPGEDRAGRRKKATGRAARGGLTTDVRREDAFFELFCEKNMMSRFLELLRSPPSRYRNSLSSPRGSSSSSSSASAWGMNGGLDAVVRALTWGGDVLRIGQAAGVAGGGSVGGVLAGGGGGPLLLEAGSYGGGGTGGGRGGGGKGQVVGRGEGRSSAEVQVQVIQTTSILVMNVKSDTSLFYLLSNNHVNDMIMYDFRLEDEEVLSHFASFLKTLSLRLNPNTVQFFLRGARPQDQYVALSASAENATDTKPMDKGSASPDSENASLSADDATDATSDSSGSSVQIADARKVSTGVGGDRRGELLAGGRERARDQDEEGASFPLYTRALEYICHGDFHVRIAALTVVLNIYNQRDPLVRAYLNGPAARSASLPDRLVGALRSQCLVLADRAMAAGVGQPAASGQGQGGSGGTSRDMMAVRDPTICRDSIAGLQDQVFYLEDVFASGQRELNAQLCESLVSRLVRPMLLGDWLSGRPGAMFPQVALCALAQLFIVVTYPPLVRLLALETLGSGHFSAGAGTGEAAGVPPPPLLSLLQGDREELCLGALVVLQALASNRVIKTDLGLAQDPCQQEDHDGFSAFENNPDASAPNNARSEETAGTGAPGAGPLSSPGGEDASMRPLQPEILDPVLDALCNMLAPVGDTGGLSEAVDQDSEDVIGALSDTEGSGAIRTAAEGRAGSPTASAASDTDGQGRREGAVPWSSSGVATPPSRPRRHHLVLRLCGKVLASLAPPPSFPRAPNASSSTLHRPASSLVSPAAVAAAAADGMEKSARVLSPSQAVLEGVADGMYADLSTVAEGTEDEDEEMENGVIARERRAGSIPANADTVDTVNAAAPAVGVDPSTPSSRLSRTAEEPPHHASTASAISTTTTAAAAESAAALLGNPVVPLPSSSHALQGGNTKPESAPLSDSDSTGSPEAASAALGGVGAGATGAVETSGSSNGSIGGCRRQGKRGRGGRETVLKRIGNAHAAAALSVLKGMRGAEEASIVAFEEEIREWSKRIGLDGAITNLPKMSSLILRWSLDNNNSSSNNNGSSKSIPVSEASTRLASPLTPQPAPPSLPPLSSSPPSRREEGGGVGLGGERGATAGSEEASGRMRQRELRSSLQAFLEIRQVWRLLSGKGETDPVVLSIAGLGPEAEEEQPREGGHLDLGGRECLACFITHTSVPPGCTAASSSSDAQKADGVGGSKAARRNRRSGKTIAATAGGSRRGRSELYLVLDAKAFLLATPDRLTNGEVKSAAPLLHLAAAPDPVEDKRLHIRALSHRPVALMRPVTPAGPSDLLKAAAAAAAASADGNPSKSRQEGKLKGGRAGVDGTESNGMDVKRRDVGSKWWGNGGGGGVGVGAGGGGGGDEGGGDAGSMCDMQAWACELSFENARSCRLARKHMESRRLRLRSEKTQCITDLLEACVQGRDQ